MATQNSYNPAYTSIEERARRRQEQVNLQREEGVIPQPTPQAPAQPQKYLGVEMTPNSDDKGFGRKVLEDAAMLSYAIPVGLAQAITNPFTFAKQVPGALVQSVKDAVDPDYYKAHPLLGVVNLAGFVAPIAGAAKSASVNTGIKIATNTAVKQAVTLGVEESIINTAFKSSVIKGAVKQGLTDGNLGIVSEVVRGALVKGGVADDVALRVGATMTDSLYTTFSRQSTKMRVLEGLAHPVSSTGRILDKATSPIRQALFGTPAKTAVAKIYGADVVAKNPESFLAIERWAEAQVGERGLKNTIANRQRVMNEWVEQNSQWASLTPEGRIAHFRNYAEQDLTRLKLHDATGIDIVTTKSLPQSYVDSMVATIKEAPANLTREELVALMEDTFGNDFKIHSAEINAAIDSVPAASFKDAMVDSVSKLGNARALVSFEKFSPEIQQLAKDIEGTGYRIAPAPTNKPVSFAADVLAGGVNKADQFQVGITSAQSISPNTAVVQKLATGNQLFEAGSVKEGLATLQDVTRITKNELSNVLDDGATKVSRLETDTHGLYFGNPEPSYWLTIKSGDAATTLASLAQFAKRNAQDSFITARKLLDGETGSYGLTLKFRKALTDEDIIAVEKLVNEKGIGLTLNQKTGEAIAYNIKQWDGLSPEQFVETAKVVSTALKDAGYDVSKRIDSYDIGVYTKDTYDGLINKSSGAVQRGSEVGGQAGQQLSSAGRASSRVSDGDIKAQRTAFGKWTERFGFSPEGVVEGAAEYTYRNNFTQRLLNSKIGATVKAKSINSDGMVTIPVEKVFEWLDKNKHIIRGTRRDYTLPARTVFDLTEDDFLRAGFTKEVARELQSVSKASLREVPASVIGMGDVVVNYLKTGDKGFAKWWSNFYNPYLKAAYRLRYDLSPFFSAQQWLETRINSAMFLKNGAMLSDVGFLPGGKTAMKLGRWTQEKLADRLKSTEKYLPKIIGEPSLPEQVIVRDEILGTLQKTMLDYTSSPDLINIAGDTAGKLKGLAGESAFSQSIQSRNFWFALRGESSVRMATQFNKALAEKFGMSLDEALSYTYKNGQKVYKNPEMLKLMRESTQSVFHYKEGFMNSPLAKTMNIVWFPFRFQAKTTQMAAKWLGSLSPTNKMLVMNNWVNFANWAGTEEGIQWRRTNRNYLYQIIAYATAYEQMGTAIEAVSKGNLFGGNTGLVGGVPLGFMVNIARELALMPEDPDQFDPKTGRRFQKETPREIPSAAALSVALEQLIIQMMPSMPLYSLTAGVISGVSTRKYTENLVRMFVGGIREGMEGRDPTEGKERLERDFKRVPLEYNRLTE